MVITSLKIRKIDEERCAESKLKGIASIVLDNMFAIHDIKILQSEDGNMFLAMPSRRASEGFKDICHPINAECRDVMERLIFAGFQLAKDNNLSYSEMKYVSTEKREFMELSIDDYFVCDTSNIVKLKNYLLRAS